MREVVAVQLGGFANFVISYLWIARTASAATETT